MYGDKTSHSGILYESDDDDDRDNSEKQYSGHYTLDTADGRVTGLIKPTFIGTTVV